MGDRLGTPGAVGFLLQPLSRTLSALCTHTLSAWSVHSLDKFGLDWQFFNAMAEKQQIVCQGSDKLYAKVKILPYFQVHKPWNYYNLNCDNALFQFFLPKRNKV